MLTKEKDIKPSPSPSSYKQFRVDGQEEDVFLSAAATAKWLCSSKYPHMLMKATLIKCTGRKRRRNRREGRRLVVKRGLVGGRRE